MSKATTIAPGLSGVVRASGVAGILASQFASTLAQAPPLTQSGTSAGHFVSLTKGGDSITIGGLSAPEANCFAAAILHSINSLTKSIGEYSSVVANAMAVAAHEREVQKLIGTIQLVSLGDPEITLVHPIPVALIQDDDEVIASFVDANISSGGAGIQEAVSGLQCLIADMVRLHSTWTGPMGDDIARQKQVLSEVCRVSPNH